MKKILHSLGISLSLSLAAVAIASEADVAKETKTPEPRFKISGWIDSGITFNPQSPDDNQNFGRLFDDRANEPMLNQLVLNFERALAPQPGEFDWGFKLQLMYGSDARVIHSLGLLDRASHEIVQPDVVEAYLNLHLPVVTAGGVDLKLGKFVTLEGAETIDPRTNFFYSHSYIFDFGIPFNHTGGLATLHATKWLDLMAGATVGVNTTEDNNNSPSFHGGIGLNLLDGKFVVAASTHVGPETPHDDHDIRYLNTITTTWKISDKLTSITDLNYALDEATDAKAFGIAQYFTYAITDWLTAGIRGEIFRDDQGFYVVSFADNDDAMDLLRGTGRNIDVRTVGGGRTTYGAITAGVNIKPAMSKPISDLTIRPELRYDRSLNDTRPFNDSGDIDQFTVGVDFILTF